MKQDENIRRALMCTGKHRHDTFTAAKRQLKLGKKKNKAVDKTLELSAYHCDFCGGFHIGHGHRKRRK
jgi:hypothetical protein